MKHTNKLVVLDNGGLTFDRYTIIDKSTGDMIGASDNPFHPLGFGQFCGNVGKVIEFDTLPDDVQKFAKQSFTPDPVND